MNGCATDPSQRTALGRDCDALMRMNHSSTVPRHVLGPNGNVLTLSDLPASTRNRWVVRRKAEVVAAIRGGLLSLEEACRRYTLTIDEFRAWESSIERDGFRGLKATRLHLYRQRTARVQPSCGANRRARRRRPRKDARTEGRDWLFAASSNSRRKRNQQLLDDHR